jgi:predicted amidohydrolase YtcJ
MFIKGEVLMSKISRREFLKCSAAASAGLMLSSCTRTSSDYADLIMQNGKIITIDPEGSIVDALAVKDGLITAVGKVGDIQDLMGPKTEVVNLDGKTVTPGLVDSHIHVVQYGKQTWGGFTDIRYPNVRNKDDLIRVISEAVSQVKEGEWISGNQGFMLPIQEAPDRWELDELAPNNPIYLKHMGGQYAVVNSYALKLAGIDKDTPNPALGKIRKDPDTGEPNGFLGHYTAQALIGNLAPGWGERSDQDLMDDIVRGQMDCLKVGYTSGQDVIVSSTRDVAAYEDVWQARDLKMRMYLMQYVSSPDHAREQMKAAKKIQSGMLTFGGWKFAMDGGGSAGTALMYDTGMAMSKAAYPFYHQETVNKMVTVMHQEGYQVSFHCVGDRAIDMAIDAIEAALLEKPDENHRHRIEHLLFPTNDALHRIKDLGIIVSTQPNWVSMLSDAYQKVSNEETMKRMIPLRTLVDMGIPLAFGCDVPATPFIEPNWSFAGAVTRTTFMDNVYNPEQAISMEEALRIHTLGSAYASFEEDVKGSLEPGKAADLVVWSHDLLTLDPKVDLVDLEPLSTYVAGKPVFTKETG